jgi:hypothetical protein
MRTIFFIIFLTWLLAGCNNTQNDELLFIEPASGDSFHYPYFLFIPDQVAQDDAVFMVIEPNNTGFVDDDFQKHIEKAERTATRDFYLGNYVAQKLNYPLLVPVFPRSMSEWKIYTHALDRDVMLQKGNQLERIDNQLLAMFEDARIRLSEKGIQTKVQFLLTGFSASGTFANRFTLIHADKVFAVAAGGLNGLLMIPADSLAGEALNYPIGTNDFRQLFGRDFQEELFLQTPQFYFMGETDDNDAVDYDDGYDQDERDLIYMLMGKEMQPTRWNYCRDVYMLKNVNAIIKVFDTIGHEHPEPVKNEIVEFFRFQINKELALPENTIP